MIRGLYSYRRVYGIRTHDLHLERVATYPACPILLGDGPHPLCRICLDRFQHIPRGISSYHWLIEIPVVYLPNQKRGSVLITVHCLTLHARGRGGDGLLAHPALLLLPG